LFSAQIRDMRVIMAHDHTDIPDLMKRAN